MTPREQRAALLRLLLVVVGGLVASAFAGALATVLVVASLLVMIVLHEAGHYVTARWSGMKVSEFFVGFGPTLWAVQRGETLYGVKALPLGGYCKILGMNNLEEVSPAEEHRAYRSKAPWHRVVVACAGSFVHFTLAFVMLVVLFVGPGDLGNFEQPPADNPIAAVVPMSDGPSPAQLAGLHPGDRIEAINGVHFRTLTGMDSYIQARPGQAVTLTVDRQGRILHLTADLTDTSERRAQGESLASRPTGFLGVQSDVAVHYGLGGAFVHAGKAFGSTMVSSTVRLASRIGDFGSYLHMIGSQKAADKPGAVRFVSPVGVVRLANQASQIGFSEVLYLLIIINIFVGVFNMVPLLPLDGGLVAIALYEKVRSRRGRPYRADVSKMVPVLYAVVAILAFYAVSSLFLDIRDLVS